jgi:metabotropic glutamate receptor 2/3
VFAYISSPGDIILGGLFPVHKEGDREDVCGPFNEIPGYQYMEAMRFAVDQINNSSDILPGIRLGTIIYDTCRSPTITADHTKDFIKLSLGRHVNGSEFAGVIGPFTSGNSIIVANFLRVFQIPQIGYGGLTVELSNKDRYGYFFRTVPPDSYFAEGLARLLEKFRWKYVSIIYSTGKYPESGTEEVVKALSKRDICVAKQHRLARFPRDEDFNKAISDVLSVEQATVIVFITIQRDSRGLLRAKKNNPLAKRLAIVASVSWSNRDDITEGLGTAAQGTITFGHMGGRKTEFENYFRSLNLSNYPQSHRKWFEEFWENRFQCSLGKTSNSSKRCTGNENLSLHQMEIAPVRVVINAVYAMAYSLENMRKILCPNSSGMCSKMKPLSRNLLQKLLKNVTFPDSVFNWPITFNRNNEVAGNYTVFNFQESEHVFVYNPVGNWTSTLQENGRISGKLQLDTSEIRWPNGETTPTSRCSQDCALGDVKQPRFGEPEICCWDCVTCKKYDVILNDTCHACDEGYVPDGNVSSCVKLEVHYVSLGRPFSVFLAFFAFGGIITTVTASVVFYTKRNHQLIKATHVQSGYFIFSGIFLIFITCTVFVAKPTPSLCYAQRFLLGNSFTICYAALLVKLKRIRDMSENQARDQRDSTSYFRDLRPHLIITVSIVIIQALLTVLIITRNTPNLQENFHFETGELLLECSLNSSVFGAHITGNIFLVCICTAFAFLTRNIEKNFHETRYISFTTYTSNVLWLVLLVFFLNYEDSFTRQYLIAGISLLIGWFTLVGLFAPVFYHLRTKTDFNRASLFDWDGSVVASMQDEQSGLYNRTPQLNTRSLTTFSRRGNPQRIA